MQNDDSLDAEIDPGREYGEWHAPMVLVDRLTQAEICLKHLEKYTDGHFVGDPSTFKWFTFSSCLLTTAQIASEIANDRSASTLYRREAMETLLLFGLGPISLRDEIDPAVLKDLINTDDDDDMSTWYLLSIVKTLAVHAYPDEYEITANEVDDVFRKFSTQLRIGVPVNSSGMIEVLPAFQLLSWTLANFEDRRA